MTGVHRLEHVERFLAADLADDDAVGTHTQRVDHQLPLADRALAFDVRRPRLEPGDVFLVELQFGRVLDRDDALTLGDEARQHVEQRRLAGAGAAADDGVEPGPDAVLRNSSIGRVSARSVDEILGLEPLGRESGGSRAAGRRPRAAG